MDDHLPAPGDERLEVLARLGVRRHTALAYAHRPGVAQWLNRHTLGDGWLRGLLWENAAALFGAVDG